MKLNEALKPGYIKIIRNLCNAAVAIHLYNNVKNAALTYIKFITMNTNNYSSNTHPVIQVVKNLINKLRQSPDIYPIKYYKKSSRYRRNWKSQMEK